MITLNRKYYNSSGKEINDKIKYQSFEVARDEMLKRFNDDENVVSFGDVSLKNGCRVLTLKDKTKIIIQLKSN